MFVDVEYYELWGFTTNFCGSSCLTLWLMAHHWHSHQRQRSTDIHKPYFRLIAYWRYAHKQGKDERQRAEAECQ